MKKIIQMFCAVLLSFLLVNGITFLFERPVGYIYTPNGASRAIRRPGSFLVHNTEGHHFSQIDKNGFINDAVPLGNSYVLVMGASHTLGKELPRERNFTSIVNEKISDSKDSLSAYNIACDGHFFPSIIHHFESAVLNYPDTNCVVIEIWDTDFSIEELQQATTQIEHIDKLSAHEIFDNIGTAEKIKLFIKEAFPLISMIKSHIQTISKEKSIVAEYSVNKEEYRSVITDCLLLIRSEYNGPIVFVYHPNTEIQKDGFVRIVRSQTLDIFREVCRDTGIDFIDTGDAFLEHYNEYYELPYGFANTTPGSGHLNEVGHQIMANAIIDYLEEVGCK